MDGALLQATAAADTAIDALVLAGEVDQFVHESLTKPFFLGGTVGTVRHHGKIGVHAAVPAAETLDFLASVEVLHIIALTCGTHKGAGTAA